MGLIYFILGAILAVAFVAYQLAVEYPKVPTKYDRWREAQVRNTGDLTFTTVVLAVSLFFGWPLTLLGFGLFFFFKKKFPVQNLT